MLRVGMTNPPFMLQHLDAVAAILRDPRVFSYLHVPVRRRKGPGSDGGGGVEEGKGEGRGWRRKLS